MTFAKASRREPKMRMALIGPSGSGKTWTALAIASHLVPGGKIALIDTGHGSASLYAGEFDFDVLELDSFSVENYIAAINEAERAGYDVLIVNSLSHAWAGKDGVLEYKDRVAAATSSRDDFGAWRKASPRHNSLIDRVLSARLHLIATMRVKTEYVVERGADGRNHPRKVGLAPVQRDQIEYGFAVIADITQDHDFVVSKSRCHALTDMVLNKAGKEVADVLRKWLADGVTAQVEPTTATQPPASSPDYGEPAGGVEAHPTSVQPTPAPFALPVVSQPPTNGAHAPLPGSGKELATSEPVKPAIIKTGKWAAVAKVLAERCPFYARDNLAARPQPARLRPLAQSGATGAKSPIVPQDAGHPASQTWPGGRVCPGERGWRRHIPKTLSAAMRTRAGRPRAAQTQLMGQEQASRSVMVVARALPNTLRARRSGR